MAEEIKNSASELETKKNVEYSAIADLVQATLTTSSGSTFTLDDLKNWLANPLKYADKVRFVSDTFYNANGIYKNLVNTFTNLPTLDYLILPSAKTLGKTQDKSYPNYFDKVNAYAESINIKLTTRKILKSIARYGVYIGYQRNSGSDYTIQTLPIDYCRVKYKVGNDYQIEFNFKYFDKFFTQENLDLAWTIYPPEFKKGYNAYTSDKKSTNPEWQMIDIKSTICIMYDDDEAFFMPMFSGIFEPLIYHDDYKDMLQLSQKLEITKLIVQKVPTDKDGNLLIPLDLVDIFHERLKGILPDGATPLTTPLDIHDVPFTNAGKEREDILAKSERSVFVAGGMSSSLFAENGGHIGLTMNIEAVSANIYSILEKIEDVFTRKFLGVVNSKNYNFKLKFFRTTNVNVKDAFDRMTKLVEIGGALQPLISLAGLDAESYITLLEVEKQLGIKDLLQVPQSMHTQTANGAPVKSATSLGDSGARAQDLGSNNPNNQQ